MNYYENNQLKPTQNWHRCQNQLTKQFKKYYKCVPCVKLISREIKDIKKTEITLLEMKTIDTMYEMKNTLDGINGR